MVFDRFVTACTRMAVHTRHWAERIWLWMGPSVSSVAGSVNWLEATKVVILALTSGGVSGALRAVVSAPGIFVDPRAAASAGSAVAIIVGILDYLRRRKHDALQL